MRGGGRCYGGNLSLSLFRSLAPALLFPGALCSQQRHGGSKSKRGKGKEGEGESVCVFMQGRVETAGRRNRGSFPQKIRCGCPDPVLPPTPPSLIARAVMSRQLTPRRAQPQQQQAPFHLPEKAALKGAPAVANGRERGNPHPIPFRQRNWAQSLYGPGVRRLGPQGFRQPPQGNRVRDDYGRAYKRPRPKQAKRLGRPVSCPRPAGKSPNGIPP